MSILFINKTLFRICFLQDQKKKPLKDIPYTGTSTPHLKASFLKCSINTPKYSEFLIGVELPLSIKMPAEMSKNSIGRSILSKIHILFMIFISAFVWCLVITMPLLVFKC